MNIDKELTKIRQAIARGGMTTLDLHIAMLSVHAMEPDSATEADRAALRDLGNALELLWRAKVGAS